MAALLLPVLLVLPACDSSNPVAPAPPADPAPGSTGTFSIALSLVPQQLQQGEGGTLSVTVRRRSNQEPPPAGTSVDLNSNDFGYFGLDGGGKPVRSTTVSLVGGAGQTPFFAGDEVGSAEILALFEDSTASLTVEVMEATAPPFFVSSVSPDVGSGTGGTAVTIAGQGFTDPLRVTFGDANAQVVDGTITGSTVQVRVPPAVPALESGETRRVDVTVTIDLDQEEPRSDTLTGGFLYSQGGGPFNQPALFSVSPTSGSNEGNEKVTLLGQGFESDARVFFGFDQGSGSFQGVEARVDTAPASGGTSMIVLSPPATGAGRFLLNQIVDVKVENPRTGLSDVLAAAYQYGSSGGGSLLVSTIDPPNKPYTAMESDGSSAKVTLLGQGFGDPGNTDLRITLAGVRQDAVTVVNDSTVEITLAAATPSACVPVTGPATVTQVVTGEAATSSGDFTYTVPSPLITGLSPGSGSEAGGTSVTFTGSGFLGSGVGDDGETVEVTFDGVRATVNAVTATSVRVATPAFTGTFDTETCDDNGDGVTGTRNVATAVDVVFTNLANGCSDSLTRSFTYVPTDTDCNEAAAGELEASFTFIVSGLTVTFKNTSSGSPTEFFWDFGDNTTGIETTAEDPIHTYAAGGTYTVTLTITDAAGGNDSASQDVTVSGP